MAASKKGERSLVVSRSLLQSLAGDLKAEWLDLGRNLGVSDARLHNIEADNRGNTKEAKYQMLLTWKEANGREATHSGLAEALVKAGRKGLSEKVKHEADKSWKQLEENDFSSLQATSPTDSQQTIEEPSVNRSAVGNEHIRAFMNEKKSQFVTELKYKYNNQCKGIQPAPFLREKYGIHKIFVESEIKFLEEKRGGGVGKDKEKWTTLGTHGAIFTDQRVKSKRRIIDGEPGYGKSALALQITHDWLNETPPMNGIEILILLRLRQFKSVPTVYSAIKKFLLPKDSKVTEDDIKSILDNSSTVILLDGYDEYPDQKNNESDIAVIIRGEMFLNHEVVLTTRTSCLPSHYSHDTIRIRLTGFDDAAKETYIRYVVAVGCSKEADKIHQFLRKNAVPADLCNIPLFFAMISHMVHKYERFDSLKTVTEFFRHIIKCFHSHDQLKDAEEKDDKELDHSTLDKIAFDGLAGDAQQISWDKTVLMGKIGGELYDQYVRIGILVEEESYDYDAMAYKTECTLFHKLFVEWYAAHYLAKAAGQREATFEPWPDSRLYTRNQAAHRSRRLSPVSEKVNVLKSLTPHDLHYMYRYACGLNNDAALKIIEHLGKEARYDTYSLLCIKEWGGDLEKITDTITLLCSRGIRISGKDSSLLQQSTVDLIKSASDRKIPIYKVYLDNCLNVGSTGDLCLKPSNLSLPASDSLRELCIDDDGLEITEEDSDSILQYSTKCLGLWDLRFNYCLLPPYIKKADYLSDLKSRNVRVNWRPGSNSYLLNLESGQWETLFGHRLMTDEDYQKVVEFVHPLVERRRRRQAEQKGSTTSKRLAYSQKKKDNLLSVTSLRHDKND